MTNPIKPNFKTEFFSILLILSAVIASFYFYANFPEQVPIHWNAAGEPDNYGSRALGAFLFPAIIIGMYVMFLFLPLIDPKKQRYDQFKKVYHIFKTILLFVFTVIYFIASFNALGFFVPIEIWIPVLIGLLFIVLGNYMSKIKPNWFVGIKTPWTLSSEEVWNKTHRVGGKVFIASGFLFLITPFIPLIFKTTLFVINILFILVGTVGYSYWLYRQEAVNKLENKH